MNKDHLIACHCKGEHSEILLTDTSGKQTSFKSEPLQSHSEYVDVVCGDSETKKSWEQIASNSKDYIWTIGCPIYMVDSDLSQAVLKTLLEDGWRILRNGGSIVIQLPKTNINEYVKSIEEMNKKVTTHNWKFSIKEIYDVGYVVHKKDSAFQIENPMLFITKPITGGRKRSTRRRRKTLRK